MFRRFVKRTLALMTILVILSQMLTITASADAETQFVAVAPTGAFAAGEEFNVAICVVGNPGFNNFAFETLYDAESLEYVSAAAAALLNTAGVMFLPYGAIAGRVNVTGAGSGANVVGDGVIYTIRFKTITAVTLDENSFSLGLLNGILPRNSSGQTIESDTLATKPSPMKAYAPVTLTQSGTVDDNDVQYQTGAAVADALPKSVFVELDGGAIPGVAIPITWSEVSAPAYNPEQAGFYTFTASWGEIPAFANNDNNLAAPTCVVEVRQSPPSALDPLTESSVYGEKTLNQIALTPNPADEIAGTWAWSEPNADAIYPKVATAYQATFTPDDGSAPRTRGVTPAVTPKAIIVTVTPVTITYGQAVPMEFTINAPAGALVGTDSTADLNLTFSVDAPVGPTVSGSPYNVTGMGNNPNYSVTVSGNGALTVEPATALTITTAIGDMERTAYEARSYTTTDALASWLLPGNVNVTTDTGAAALPITWSTAAPYNARGTEYTFTGKLSGNDNILAPSDLSLSVHVTVTPVSAVIPIFAGANMHLTTNEAMTADDVRAVDPDLLPTSGTVTVAGESIAYTIDWNGEQNLDGATTGASQTFTGTAAYPEAPAWLTIPEDLVVSRTIMVGGKQTTTVTLDDPVDVVYGTAFEPPAASAAAGGTTFIYTYSGLANDGAIFEDDSEPPVKAGQYSVTATLVSDTHTGAAVKEFSVEKKPITASATDASRAYLAANPTFDFVFDEDDLVYGDAKADLAVSLSTAATAASPAGPYPITGASASANYAVAVQPGVLTVTKIAQSTPVTVTLSRDSIALDAVSDLSVSASGGDGTGAYLFSSSDDAVATFAEDGSIVLVSTGETEITAMRAGDQNYNDSDISEAVTLTVLPNTSGDGTGGATGDWMPMLPQLTTLSGLQTPLTWPNPYIDVDETDWFYEAVRFVTEEGLMNGTSASRFSPGAVMTRAMMVTVLYRLEGSPDVSGGMPFPDVPTGRWYSDAIAWAGHNEIVYGYHNGAFGPNDPITREQAVVILHRYALYKNMEISASDDLSGFTDGAVISDWALEAMRWAVAEGIVEGYSDNAIAPRNSSSRAEIAAMFQRFMEWNGDT